MKNIKFDRIMILKKLILIILILSILFSYFSILNAETTINANGVRFYEYVDYDGTSTKPIPKGFYSLSDLQKFGFKSNWASSVRIPEGYTIKIGKDQDLMQDKGFWVFNQEDINTSDFNNFGGNDVASAVEVHKGVTFYARTNYFHYYDDISLDIEEGNYKLKDLEKLDFKNDWASSVTIPKGWSVQLYEDDNFQGKMWELNQMDKNSADLNLIGAAKKISSIKVIGKGVKFYHLAGCTGDSTKPIPEGNYPLDQLESKFEFKENWASSVNIPEGYTVRLYLNSNDLEMAKTNSWTLTQEDSKSNDFKTFTQEYINAVEVRKGITFYNGGNCYMQSTKGITEGFYTLDTLESEYGFKPSYSSVSIPKGWSVRLYEKDNFEGRMWELNKMDTNSNNLHMLRDDGISSIQVIGTNSRISNFRVMSIYREKKNEGIPYFRADDKTKFMSEFYLNDKASAMVFADSLTCSNSEAWRNFMITYFIGLFSGGTSNVASGLFTLDAHLRNDLAIKIKNLARNSNGKIYFAIKGQEYYDIFGKNRAIEKTECKVWDSKEIYGRKADLPVKSLSFSY